MLCRCFSKAPSDDEHVSEVVTDVPDQSEVPQVKTPASTSKSLSSSSRSFTNRTLNGTGSGAQEENLAWMNYIISSMWPKFRSAGNKMGKTIALQELKNVIREQNEQGRLDIDVDLEVELDLGDNPPIFSAVRTYHTGHDETEGVEVDLAMSFRPKDSWSFKCNVNGKISHIPISCVAGVSYFECSGVCSVVLTPLLDVFPVFAGGQIFFLDTPTVTMQFDGMAGLHNLAPLVMNTLRAAVVKNLQAGFVLPNSKFIAIRNIPLDTRVDLTSPLPEGVLQVTVHSASGLKASDFSLLGKGSSDPVVEVQIGSAKFSTRIIKKNLNPVWDPPEYGYLFVHNPNQALNVEVYDADTLSDKDFLAYLNSTSVIEALETRQKGAEWPEQFNLVPAPPGPGEKPLAKDEESPKITLSLDYLEVCDLPSDHHISCRKKVKASSSKGHRHGGPRNLDCDHVTLLRVCSVRLLGLDCSEEVARNLWHAVVHLTVSPGPGPWHDAHPDRVLEQSKSLDTDIEAVEKRALQTEVSTSWFGKVSRGIAGLAKADDNGPVKCLKSHKAKLWGAEGGPVGAKGAGLPRVAPQVQMMIERLHLQKNMGIAEIAEISGLDEETVKLLVELRREFKVVWHQSLHVQLEHPGYTIDMEVKTVDGTSLGKVHVDLQKDLGKSCEYRQRVKIGTESFGEVTFEFEVELRGLRHAELCLPDGFRRESAKNFHQHQTERQAVTLARADRENTK